MSTEPATSPATERDPTTVDVADVAWNGDLLARIYSAPAVARTEPADQPGPAVVDGHRGDGASRGRTLGGVADPGRPARGPLRRGPPRRRLHRRVDRLPRRPQGATPRRVGGRRRR